MKKRLISIVLIIVFCVSVVVIFIQPKKKGEIILETNGGLPREWTCKSNDESIAVIGDVNSVDKDHGADGGRVDIHYIVNGVKEGTTQVVCSYTDTRTKEVTERKGFDITVDRKLNVNVKETNNFEVLGDNLDFTIGKEWNFEIEDESIVKVDSKVENDDYYTYSFKGLKEGSTNVRFYDKNGIESNNILYVDKELNVKNTTNKVVVEKNGGTPYEWKYEIKDDSIVEMANKESVEEKEGVKGGLVFEKYSFVGIEPGLTEVVFTKVNTLDNSIKETKKYYIEVGMYLDVNIVEVPDAEIVLTTNGGLPREWKYSIKDNSIVTFSKIFDLEKRPGTAGGEIYQHYFLKGLKEGTTTIKFEYVNTIGDKDVVKEENYTITVDKDLKVTIVENK